MTIRHTYPKPPIATGKVLLLDDFDGPAGSKPNPAIWEFKTLSGQHDASWDGDKHVHLDGLGHAIFDAVRQPEGSHKPFGSCWASTSVDSFKGFNGAVYLDCRARVASGAGAWSAPLWSGGFPWDNGGIEIDVCEQLGREPTIYHTTAHNWDLSPEKERGQADIEPVTLAAAFHTYGAAVYPDRVAFYFDGKLAYSVPASDIGSADPTKPLETLNMCLDMGGWGGAVDPALDRARMKVGYVRALELM